MGGLPPHAAPHGIYQQGGAPQAVPNSPQPVGLVVAAVVVLLAAAVTALMTIGPVVMPSMYPAVMIPAVHSQQARGDCNAHMSWQRSSFCLRHVHN